MYKLNNIEPGDNFKSKDIFEARTKKEFTAKKNNCKKYETI